MAGGVLALQSLNKLGAEQKTQGLTKMMALMTADGTFKMSSDDDKSSTKNVHYALEMLRAIGGDQAGSDLAVDVFEKAFRMLPGGDFEGESDATLMVPLSKLTDKKLRLVGDRLNAVAEFLLNKKHSTCMTCLSRVYDALELVTQYKATPLHISFEHNRFDTSKPATHKLKVDVKNILGTTVEVESVEVVTIKTVGKDSAFLQGEKAVDGVLDMSAASLVPGRYLAQVIVNVAGRTKPSPFSAYFVVTDTIDIKDVRFQLLEGGEESVDAESPVLSTQNVLQGVTVTAMSGDKLRISFSVASHTSPASTRKPHQAFVRFTHAVTGHAVSFMAKKDTSAGSSGLGYSAVVSIAESTVKFDHTSGVYAVTVIVGDAAYSVPVEWVLGSVELRFSNRQSDHLPLYSKSLLHSSDVTLQPLSEIEHVMRPPAKRASNFMATIFTGLTIAPLVVFVVFILSLRPDLGRMGSIPSLAAIGCLALMLVLYVSYWLSLEGVSFYDTIRYLCFLTPITMIVGSFSLASVKAKRQQSEKHTKEKKN